MLCAAHPALASQPVQKRSGARAESSWITVRELTRNGGGNDFVRSTLIGSDGSLRVFFQPLYSTEGRQVSAGKLTADETRQLFAAVEAHQPLLFGITPKPMEGEAFRQTVLTISTRDSLGGSRTYLSFLSESPANVKTFLGRVHAASKTAVPDARAAGFIEVEEGSPGSRSFIRPLREMPPSTRRALRLAIPVQHWPVAVYPHEVEDFQKLVGAGDATFVELNKTVFAVRFFRCNPVRTQED